MVKVVSSQNLLKHRPKAVSEFLMKRSLGWRCREYFLEEVGLE
jgi:hypothetical protein